MNKLTDDMKKKIIECAEYEPSIPAKSVNEKILLTTYLNSCDDTVLPRDIKKMLIEWFPRGTNHADTNDTVDALYTFTNGNNPGLTYDKKKTHITKELKKYIVVLNADNDNKLNTYETSEFECVFQRLLRNILVDVGKETNISNYLENHKATKSNRYDKTQKTRIDTLFKEIKEISLNSKEDIIKYITQKIKLHMNEMKNIEPSPKCTNYSEINIITGNRKSSDVIAQGEIAEVEQTIVSEEEEEMFNDILKLNYTITDPLTQPNIIPAAINGFSIIRDYHCDDEINLKNFVQPKEFVVPNVNLRSTPIDRNVAINADIKNKTQNINIEGQYWDYKYDGKQGSYKSRLNMIYNVFNDTTLDEQGQIVKSLDIIKIWKDGYNNKDVKQICGTTGFKKTIKQYCLIKMKAIYKNRELAKYNLFLLLQKIICMSGKCDTGLALFSSKESVDRLNYNMTGYLNFFTSPGIDHEGSRHVARELSRVVRFTFITYWKLYKLGFVSPVELIESYEKTKTSTYWDVNKVPLMASLSLVATYMTTISKFATTANLTSIANTAGDLFKISMDTIQKISLAFPFVGAGIASIAGLMAFIYSTDFYKQRSEDYSVYMFFHKCRREFEYNFNIFCDKIKMSPYKIYVDIDSNKLETFESCNWLSIRHEISTNLDLNKKDKRKHPDFVKRIILETNLTEAPHLVNSGYYLFDNEFMVPKSELYQNSLNRNHKVSMLQKVKSNAGGNGDQEAQEAADLKKAQDAADLKKAQEAADLLKKQAAFALKDHEAFIPNTYLWKENNSENEVSQHCKYWDDAQEYINIFSLLLNEITIYNYKVSQCYDNEIKILLKFIKLYRVICAGDQEDFIDKDNEVEFLNKQLEFIYSIDGCKQFDNSYYWLYNDNYYNAEMAESHKQYLQALIEFSNKSYTEKKTLLNNKKKLISYSFLLNDLTECSTEEDMNSLKFFEIIKNRASSQILEKTKGDESHIEYSKLLQERRKKHMDIIKNITVANKTYPVDITKDIINNTITNAKTWEKIEDNLKYIERKEYIKNNPDNHNILLNNIQNYILELNEIFTFYGKSNNLWYLLSEQGKPTSIRDKDTKDILKDFSDEEKLVIKNNNNINSYQELFNNTLTLVYESVNISQKYLQSLKNQSSSDPETLLKNQSSSDAETLLEIKEFKEFIISLKICIRIIQQLIKRLVRREKSLDSRYTKFKDRYPPTDSARLTIFFNEINKEYAEYKKFEQGAPPLKKSSWNFWRRNGGNTQTRRFKTNIKYSRRLKMNNKKRTRRLKMNNKKRTRKTQ